eukprot:CAMPEP_0184343018 /NCGR_PEP_ID=MMETSP1089-20130417/11567_1 /TAXON_ID=38269 ORGANISM="Gloeochaete wittrockiana, Strain SAG46.84" /NCGR_SAMPLE_ID=MMETSP1089 /ASSEMBLY_ACC=CAM_ASM_000445 /LENGTH=405 /DNA_ID=CAMNT_0026672131 /DNA_START=15 /DNA_END=1232 /DNA_ORIENTATION=-
MENGQETVDGAEEDYEEGGEGEEEDEEEYEENDSGIVYAENSVKLSANEDLWDDTALVRAYEEAIRKYQEEHDMLPRRAKGPESKIKTRQTEESGSVARILAKAEKKATSKKGQSVSGDKISSVEAEADQPAGGDTNDSAAAQSAPSGEADAASQWNAYAAYWNSAYQQPGGAEAYQSSPYWPYPPSPQWPNSWQQAPYLPMPLAPSPYGYPYPPPVQPAPHSHHHKDCHHHPATASKTLPVPPPAPLSSGPGSLVDRLFASASPIAFFNNGIPMPPPPTHTTSAGPTSDPQLQPETAPATAEHKGLGPATAAGQVDETSSTKPSSPLPSQSGATIPPPAPPIDSNAREAVDPGSVIAGTTVAGGCGAEVDEEQDALARALLAWYYSGYYTGQYQALYGRSRHVG